MSLRKFFDQDRGQNYVFWMKENRNFKSANATYGNSYQKASSAELPDLIEIIDSIFKDIDSTRFRVSKIILMHWCLTGRLLEPLRGPKIKFGHAIYSSLQDEGWNLFNQDSPL
jgi:hypothetical protein